MIRYAFLLSVFLLGSTSSTFALPAKVRSSSKQIIDQTITNGSGVELGLIGVVRTKTTYQPATDVLEVGAQLKEKVFLVYDVNQVVGNVDIDDLRELAARAAVLRQQIYALKLQIGQLQLEWSEVRNTDVNPFIGGIQFDRERLKEVSNMINLLAGQMNELVKELAAIVKEMEARSKKSLDNRGEKLSEYRALGSAAVSPSTCTAGACERFLTFSLVHPDGSTELFQIKLDLEFTEEGKLLSAEAFRGCASTLVCSIDIGGCYCPAP